jgi:hypothetical protein
MTRRSQIFSRGLFMLSCFREMVGEEFRRSLFVRDKDFGQDGVQLLPLRSQQR